MNEHGKKLFKAGLAFLIISFVFTAILMLAGYSAHSTKFYLWDLMLIPSFILVCRSIKKVNREKYSHLTSTASFLLAMFLLFFRTLFFNTRIVDMDGFSTISYNVSKIYNFNLTCTIVFGVLYVFSIIYRIIYKISGTKRGYFNEAIILTSRIHFLFMWLGIIGVLFYGVLITTNLYLNSLSLPLDFSILFAISLIFISFAFMAMVRSTEKKVIIKDLNKNIFPIILIMAWHEQGRFNDVQYINIESEFSKEDIMIANNFFLDDIFMAPIYEEIAQGKYDKIMNDSLRDYNAKKGFTYNQSHSTINTNQPKIYDNNSYNDEEREILSILNGEEK